MTTPTLPPETLLAASSPSPDQQADFVGRDYLRRVIGEFLVTQNRMLVIVSPPGTGKTAFLQALEREHSADRHPYLFYSCAQSDNANPFVFCRKIAQRLHAMLGEDFKFSETVRQQEIKINAQLTTGAVAAGADVGAVQLQVGGVHPREAFRLLVREPLRAYNDKIGAQRDQQPLVILIDALDQAWDWDNGQGGSIIAALAEAQDLPAWVSIVCAARPGQAVQVLQERSGVRVYRMDPSAPENKADIRTYLQTRFLDALDADDRSALEKALQSNNAFGNQPLGGFTERVVEASQGNFLFVRRYVETLRRALDPESHSDLPALVRVEDSLDSLAAAMDSGYERVFASIADRISAAPDDGDEDVLAALAVAYGPASPAVLSRITGRSEQQVNESLERLEPLLAPQAENDQRRSFFHTGFADFYRRTRLGEKAREWNSRAAQNLDEGDSDQTVREYAGLYRWSHLRRSLRLSWPSNPTRSDVLPIAEGVPNAAMLLATAAVQEQVPQPITQAQALRGLAAQAMAPELANVPGSWSQAIDYLRAAERTLSRSRSLSRRSRRRYASVVPPEQIELERTLTALGDTYVAIGQRMDPHIPTRTRPHGLFQFIHSVWDAFARLPLTIFLLLVLVAQGTRELRLSQTLGSLGRGQDWTVARLYVLAVAAYRRALRLAQEREDDEAADDVTERLARLYTLIGAYDSAAATYSSLMARPAALARQWHQAVWRLELGEVQLANGHFNQAVDMFGSARMTFEAQNTTVQFARTLSGLARGYYAQAGIADSRNDPEIATTLYNQSLSASAQALEQWKRVAVLPNTVLGITDPNIGMSAVGHSLWEASNDERLDVEQRQRARALLDSIEERHFPQRFEHPLLRLFRLGMAIALPAYLLVGLLLAVQLPNQIRVKTATGIEFVAPNLDLTAFPDNVVTGRAPVPTSLNEGSLTSLVNSGVKIHISDSWLSYERVSGNTRLNQLSGDAIFAGILYYLSYLVVGVAILLIASPAHFQIYRPGRLVLARDTLYWRGVPGQHAVLNAWSWVRHEFANLFRRGAGIAQQVPVSFQPLSQKLIDIIILQTRIEEDQAARQRVDLPLKEIQALIFADLHILRYKLYDFSYTIVRPRTAEYPEITIDGRLVYYRELCDELARRVAKLASAPTTTSFLSRTIRRAPDHLKLYNVDLISSGWGVLFSIMLCFSAVMVALLSLKPDIARQPIARIDYSLSNLYVLIAPGLLLPLIWWCVFRPLGIWRARDTLRWPLLGAALLGAVVTAAVIVSQVSLVRYGLKPDLALPMFAAGLLFAVAWFARPQPFWPVLPFSRQRTLNLLLAIAALIGVFLLVYRVARTVFWYDAVVRGNYYLEQYYLREDCSADDACGMLAAADEYYQRAIAFDPTDNETYALRGQAALASINTEAAITYFNQAAPNPQRATAVQLANIATARMLAARQNTDPEDSIATFQAAIAGYQQALARRDKYFANVQPTCPALSEALLPEDQATPFVLREANLIDDGDTLLSVRQFADACLNLGLTRLSLVEGKLDAARNPAVNQAWHDLAGAAVGFRITADSTFDSFERQDALLGAAAAWLQLSQFSAPPQNMPDRRTAALTALHLYQELQNASTVPGDSAVANEAAAGAAWSALQLGAWDSAVWDPRTPGLGQASEDNADNPIFPALHGLIKWFDSTQYLPPTRVRPSPAYTAAITEALSLYDEAIRRDIPDVDQAYAIESLLNFSLRNSRRGAAYSDDDYGIWMQQAMLDLDRAVAEAEVLDRDPAEIAGLRYWRGRLAMSLGTTWQQKLRGPREWNEILPLYSRAYDDFTAATRMDTNKDRKRLYEDRWIPWSKALLNNSSHYALAIAALRDGRAEQAANELALIDPNAVQRFDKESAAIPDYSYLYGLTRIALGRDLSFANPLIPNPERNRELLASFAQAITDTESGEYIQRAAPDNPFDSRSVVYRSVISDINRVLTNPKLKLTDESRRRAERVRDLLADQLSDGNRTRQ